jgi:hypothetical protein
MIYLMMLYIRADEMNKMKRLKEVDGAIWFIIFLYIGLFSIALSMAKLGLLD